MFLGCVDGATGVAGEGRSFAEHQYYYVSKRTLNVTIGREQVNPLPAAMARFALEQ
jgi:hypothetical protein